MKSYRLRDVYVCKNIIKKMLKISVEWKIYVLHDLMANIWGNNS